MKRITILLFLIACTGAMQAQQSYTYELDKYATQESSFDDCRPDQRTDLENTFVYQVRHHAALFDWLVNDTTSTYAYLKRRELGVVSLGMKMRRHQGDYLFYDGRNRIAGELLAGSHFSLKGNGTLFGMASYQQRNTDDIWLNYATHPEDYAPYFVGDSLTTGDTHQEIYTVKGGYSRQLGSYHLGVDALYEGIAEHRSTNPRYANYSYWLRLAFNSAWTKGRNLISVRAYPELNRQSISASTFLNSTKYFQFYGFGQWNRRETTGSGAYARNQQIWGGGAELLYVYSGAWKWSAQLVYNYRKITTEEHNFKNLFEAPTHTWRGQVSAIRPIGPHAFYMQLSAFAQRSQGKENVYENQIQDEEQKLFDYILVGHNSFYHRRHTGIDWRGKMRWDAGNHHSLHLMAGVGYTNRDERYDMPYIHTNSQNLLPTVSVGYHKHHPRYTLECNTSAQFQCNVDNTFRYDTFQDNIFTQAIAVTPHHLQSANSQALQADVFYAHSIGKRYSLGVKGAVGYLHSDYQKQLQVEVGVKFLFDTGR